MANEITQEKMSDQLEYLEYALDSFADIYSDQVPLNMHEVDKFTHQLYLAKKALRTAKQHLVELEQAGIVVKGI